MEKYVLIASDGESIDTKVYNTKEEARKNMEKAYQDSYPKGQEEEWADMSYLAEESALLYMNGEGTWCWDICRVCF